MNELQRELFEKQLLSISKGFDYPRTPDIAGSVMRRLRPSPLTPLPLGEGKRRPRFISRRLAWSLTIILILFSSLMLIPPARAAIIEFIQIGPDRVFVQDVGGNMVVLVWIDPQQPERVLMSLHFIPNGSWAIDKMKPKLIQETTVNGQRAIWTVGPYPIRFSNGDIDFIRLIDGHVLIWADGNVTYRLETNLPLEEALKIAESLQPIQR